MTVYCLVIYSKFVFPSLFSQSLYTSTYFCSIYVSPLQLRVSLMHHALHVLDIPGYSYYTSCMDLERDIHAQLPCAIYALSCGRMRMRTSELLEVGHHQIII